MKPFSQPDLKTRGLHRRAHCQSTQTTLSSLSFTCTAPTSATAPCSDHNSEESEAVGGSWFASARCGAILLQKSSLLQSQGNGSGQTSQTSLPFQACGPLGHWCQCPDSLEGVLVVGTRADLVSSKVSRGGSTGREHQSVLQAFMWTVSPLNRIRPSLSQVPTAEPD